MSKLPKRGESRAEVLARLERARARDFAATGRTFAYVYDGGREVTEVARAAQAAMGSINAIDPTLYPSLLYLENEVVSMAASLVNAPSTAGGTFTSGGTESIMLAVKTARDLANGQAKRAARTGRPNPGRGGASGRGNAVSGGGRDGFAGPGPAGWLPRMILPITAHPAHLKAACYLGVEPVLVPVDPHTMKADPAAMERAIDDRTILLVGSAPCYPFGVIDPIGALGEIAARHEIPLHVDACVGGFLLPFLAQLGQPIEPFGFEVPGVTSLSMDAHKYGYAPKGASVLLHRDKAVRAQQHFVSLGWPGYPMISTTVQNSRSAGPLAGTWAVLRHLGDDGLLALARMVRGLTERLIQGIRSIDGLRILGSPDMTIFAVASDTASVFVVADEMKKRGWYLQAQLRCDPFPESLHLTVHPGHVDAVEPFLADLAASMDAARDRPNVPLIIDANGALPDEMAGVNAWLNDLPRAEAEVLIGMFVNELFSLVEVEP